MTDNEIIKGLKCCGNQMYYCGNKDCKAKVLGGAVDLINRQQAENESLEHKLLGVMHFVDKWLDGAELEQDEVNRASAMREKTLQIVEKLEEENDFLKSIDTDKIKAEAIKDVLDRLRKKLFSPTETWITSDVVTEEDIDAIEKEMVGNEK